MNKPTVQIKKGMTMADTRKSEVERDLSNLRNRPQRRKRRGSSSLFWLLGALLIVALLAFVGWQILGAGQNNALTTTSSGGKTGTNAVMTPVGDHDPPVYWDTLKEQIAQGLRLSESSVQSKVRSASSGGSGSKSGGSSSPPIVDIAAQQHITGSQWRTIEINAIQKGSDALVSTHTLTQQQADQRVQNAKNWSQNDLDGYINYAFTSH
jgi:hypothetical protein